MKCRVFTYFILLLVLIAERCDMGFYRIRQGKKNVELIAWVCPQSCYTRICLYKNGKKKIIYEAGDLLRVIDVTNPAEPEVVYSDTIFTYEEHIIVWGLSLIHI